MLIQLLGFLETFLLVSGLALVIVALVRYTSRTKDYGSIIRVMVNQLKEGFSIAEFKLYRLGVMLLIATLVIRFVNQLLFPS
ncbi:MAG: hypothetical protein HRU24_05300 [Gammaproteobacteria bacterium]|nr:hypothetical protein [Gammaproteobacteria bacterium]